MRLGIGTYTYTWAVGGPGRVPARPLTGEDRPPLARFAIDAPGDEPALEDVSRW